MGHGSSVEQPPLEIVNALADGREASAVAAKRASGYAAAARGRESAARRLLDLSASLEGRTGDALRLEAVREAARDLGLGCTRTYASPETLALLGVLKQTRNPLTYAALKRSNPATPAKDRGGKRARRLRGVPSRSL